jgi:hypothetical protein
MKSEDRAKTKLLSFFLTFIVILASLLAFIWMVFVTYNSHNEGVPDQRRFMQNKIERFGVAREEDIYIDNRDPNARYTAHGTLITKD